MLLKLIPLFLFTSFNVATGKFNIIIMAYICVFSDLSLDKSGLVQLPFFFFKDFIYLLRERGREGERERNISVQGVH